MRYLYRSCLAYPSGNWRYPVISWPLTLHKYVPITQELWGGVWESCIDLTERLKHHKTEKRRSGGGWGVKTKLNEKLLTYTSRAVWNIYYSESHREKRWRRIEGEKNPFGKVDADRWDWRQAGQSATEEGCACVLVRFCDVPVCVCLRAWGVPDYFPWLIRPSIRLTCRTFQSS